MHIAPSCTARAILGAQATLLRSFRPTIVTNFACQWFSGQIDCRGASFSKGPGYTFPTSTAMYKGPQSSLPTSTLLDSLTSEQQVDERDADAAATAGGGGGGGGDGDGTVGGRNLATLREIMPELSRAEAMQALAEHQGSLRAALAMLLLPDRRQQQPRL